VPCQAVNDNTRNKLHEALSVSAAIMSTNDNYTYNANTEAFFNVDIVDGDIVSINNNPRKSPVSYTDFPDIFKSSPSPPSPNGINKKRIPPPPSQPPPLPPPSPSENEYMQEPENHHQLQHGPSWMGSTAADRDAASNVFHPIDVTPFLLLKRQEENHSAETITGSVFEQKLLTSSRSSPTLGIVDSTRTTAGSSPKDVSPDTKSQLDMNGRHTPTFSSGRPLSPSFSLREQVRSGGLSKRSDFPLIPSKVALLIIDVQEFCCKEPGPDRYYHHEALPRMLDKLAILLKSFRVLRDTPVVEPEQCQKKLYREQGLEVIFSIIQSQTKDGRDLSLDYKLSGPAFTNLPTVHMPLQDLFPQSVQPNLVVGKGDIVVSKTSCSVFQSTNLDYMLRNLSIEQLVVAGQFTEQCIESAVRDAADLGYFVTVVQDACAAQSLARHTRGLEGMAGFCRIRSTSQVVDELEQQFTHPWQPCVQISTSSLPLQPPRTTPASPHRSEHKNRRINHIGYHPHHRSPSPPDHNHEPVFNKAFLRSLQHGSVSFLRYLSIDILHNLQCHVVPIEYLLQSGTLRYPVASLTTPTNSGRRSGGGGEVHSNGSNVDAEGAMLLEIEPDLSTLQFLHHVPNTATLLGALCSTCEGNRDLSPYCARSRLATILQKAKETDGIHFVSLE
jgi:ureidoacrylate peracid hydrolase